MYWNDVKLLLRMKYNNSGTMVGFYSGGKSHRGLSAKNMTMLYRHALVLGGETPENAKKFTYHGGKRGCISFQKSFGGISDKNVAVGSKHSVGGIIKEYTDANRCQLAEPAKRQCDIRQKMEAVMSVKLKHQVEEEKTPIKMKIPGEVHQEKGNVSPSEIRKMDKILNANGLNIEKVREIDTFHPGFLRCVLNLAAKSVVGVNYEGTAIAKRAMRYLKAKRKVEEKDPKVIDIDEILKANGLEMEKLKEVDKFHPGFSHCVLMMATNPDSDIAGYRSGVEMRARAYLKKKRRDARMRKSQSVLESKTNVLVEKRSFMEGSVNSSAKVTGPQRASSLGGGKENEGYELLMTNEVNQHFNYSESRVQPRTVFHKPVFNNCSFGSNPMKNMLSSDFVRKPLSPVGQQCRKRHFGEEVPARKQKFKTAKELGLSL